ncbi:MAG: DUF4230 domain-containing protein [Clostridia bacterium]|nr:DUF4230 domain-containing protein [Clostridia bacterium]
MKKVKAIIAVLTCLCLLTTGCKPKENVPVQKPDIMQIRAICNLATLECYYNNVAKSNKTGNWAQKDRKFWIEYTGIAKIGIDMSKVNMEINGTEVMVTLPDAELLNIDICENDLNSASYIQSGDGWLFKNKITAEDQTFAINSAQTEMSENVKNNRSLLLNARDRAQDLIENYIKRMGEMSGITYAINWTYASDAEMNINEKEG